MAVQSSDADASGSSCERTVSPTSPGFLTVELTGIHDIDGFVCARDLEAVKYLQIGIWDHLRKRNGSAYAFVASADPRCILGYYHLVGSSLKRSVFQNADAKKIPKDGSVSVFHLAYIARDDRAEAGVGAALVIDAARRARSIYPTWGMSLHANNLKLVSFYQSLGFKFMRSLKQEQDSATGVTSAPPFLMYADYASIIIDS